MRSDLYPYQDGDDICIRAAAKLVVHSAEASPDDITKALNIMPHKSSKKGEIIRSATNEFIRYQEMNVWYISSENEINSKELRRHIDWLLEKLDGKEEVIRIFREQGAIFKLYLSWWADSNSATGPTLWPSHMEGIAKLDIECQFSFAYYDS